MEIKNKNKMLTFNAGLQKVEGEKILNSFGAGVTNEVCRFVTDLKRERVYGDSSFHYSYFM